jgi:hypothetical protein
MTNLLSFLLALLVFVVAVVALFISRLDFIDGGLLLALSIAIMFLTYPAVLNRSV